MTCTSRISAPGGTARAGWCGASTISMRPSPCPYTNDLIRLATSALLAIESDHLALRPRPACAALLAGYRAGLEAGGRPFVLTEEHPWLRRVATRRLRDAARFWKRLDLAGAPSAEPPPEARMVLDLALPERDLPYRVHPRVAGEGSLGRQRWVAITSWRGARIAREAKARAPSASFWCARRRCAGVRRGSVRRDRRPGRPRARPLPAHWRPLVGPPAGAGLLDEWSSTRCRIGEMRRRCSGRWAARRPTSTSAHLRRFPR